MQSGIICLEGIDGAGKETQAQLLKSYLEGMGKVVVPMSFPDYNGPLGSAIKSALQSHDFNPYALQMLFSAERLRHLDRINECLKNRVFILADRYIWSSRVYAIARGLNREWSMSLETPLPKPNITILLDIDEETSLKRTGGSDLLEKDTSLMRRCRNEYIALANEDSSWIIIDGKLDSSTVHNNILYAIEGLLHD